MLHPGPARKLIVTVNESDRFEHHSLYNALLELFRHEHLAGATVLRAMAGFTGRGSIRTLDLLDLASSLPVRIEVVDEAAAIERVLPRVREMVRHGLVEVMDTTVVVCAPPGDA